MRNCLKSWPRTERSRLKWCSSSNQVSSWTLSSEQRQVLKRPWTSQVKERLIEAATQMKLGYVKRAKPARKLDGRRVHWRVPSRKTKLQATFKGPFMAKRIHHPWSYRMDGASRASKLVNVNQLKRYFNDDVALVTLQTRGWLLSTNGGVVVLSQRSD